MNKKDLVAKLAEDSGTTKKDAEAVLNSFMDTVGEVLAKGDKISLVGFGTFETSERSARKGRNPQTGKEIDIPAKTLPKFKAGKSLKDKVDQG
jgi:DNA-binding protein HU-beta